MKAKSTRRVYVVRVVVRSATGQKPIVRALGGDTVFVYLDPGMTATWTVRREPVRVAGRTEVTP